MPYRQYPVPSARQPSRLFRRPDHISPVFPWGATPLLCGALIVLTLSLQDNNTVHHLNASLINITMPVVDTFSRPFKALAESSGFLRSHKNLQAEIITLRNEKEHYLSLIQSLRQQVSDHEDLRQLVRTLPGYKAERVSARVVGRTSDGMNAMLTIHATEKLVKDQPVVTADGVVGRVSEVGGIKPSTARVMPLTDLSSRIPVEIESTHDHGIIAGQNQSELRLIHLEKRVKVKIGDRLITSGYGGIFPRGLPVAVVTEIEGDMIKARPFAHETPAYVTILLSL